MVELEELRELKSDVERREKGQAALIETQARRLDELDRLYRDEALARKKTHNAMEDLKVGPLPPSPPLSFTSLCMRCPCSSRCLRSC